MAVCNATQPMPGLVNSQATLTVLLRVDLPACRQCKAGCSHYIPVCITIDKLSDGFHPTSFMSPSGLTTLWSAKEQALL